IHQILNGGEGFSAVAQKVLGVTLPNEGNPGYSVWVGFDGGATKGRDGILTAQINIRIPNTSDARRAADAILSELPARLRGVLQREYQRNLGALRTAIAQSESDARECEQSLERLEKLEVELREQAGQAELSREGVLRMIRDYEEKKRDTELLVATQAAR